MSLPNPRNGRLEIPIVVTIEKPKTKPKVSKKGINQSNNIDNIKEYN